MKLNKKAFHWIVNILKKHRIPFQVSGGLAAKIYGAKRKLADIDLDIPEQRFNELLPDIKKYIVFGPGRYKDDCWDLQLITLRYKGQSIDISGARQAHFDKSKKKWKLTKVDFSRSEIKKVFGVKVPVIAKKDLIKYKRRLGREVDLLDVKEIAGA